MKYSIIIRCYNNLTTLKKSVEAAIETTDDQAEIILVNNHPPEEAAKAYLEHISHPRVKVVDPQRNIGNSAGLSFGSQYATGENIVILDDDIIVPQNDWISAMSKVLDDYPNLAYVSLIWPAVKNDLVKKQGFQQRVISKPEYSIYFEETFTVFGCVMIRSNVWKQHFSDLIKGDLYGIDGYYQQKANELGMKTAYLLSHMPDHLARTESSDALYGAYKVIYAFGLTSLDYNEWRNSKPALSAAEMEALGRFGYKESEIGGLQSLMSK